MVKVDWGLIKRQMDDPDPIAREDAIYILQHAGVRDEKIDTILINILENDSSKKVRLAAARFVSETGDKRFEESLFRLLCDMEASIRGTAFWGLLKIDPQIRERTEIISFIEKEISPLCLQYIRGQTK
ncbi:MAG: hypothetical protein PHF50_01600 [Patescibacteria group bacterium]|nr:hypothetical protein [Patescibacteria group bacterium]